MTALKWFDSWVERGPFTPRDLGRYRIVYSLLLLLLAPQIRWLAPYPDSFYEPAPGPFKLLNGFPSEPVLTAIEIAVFVLIAAVGFGLYTTFSSIALTVALIADFGLAFSVGKIDHSMVMVMVPLILAFARWGDSYSIDALRRSRSAARATTDSDPGGATRPDSSAVTSEVQLQWPMRFLALAIGLAFVTAALPKLLGGWLSLASQASYGYQVQSHFVSNRTSWLSSMLVDVHVPVVWELLDWVTVLLEGLVVLAVLSWRSWRIALAVLALFHVGIGLSLGIYFASNVIAYAAFVSWGLIKLPTIELSERTRGMLTRAAIPLVLIGGLLCWLIGNAVSPQVELVRALIVFAGGAVALYYLFGQVRELLALRRARGNKVVETATS